MRRDYDDVEGICRTRSGGRVVQQSSVGIVVSRLSEASFPGRSTKRYT